MVAFSGATLDSAANQRQKCADAVVVSLVTDGGLTSLKQTGSKGILPGNVSETRGETFFIRLVCDKHLNG